MPTYHVEFGHLGDSRPVPDFSITTDDINEFHRAVARHAIPHMRPVLKAMGHPEYADCFFHINDDRTAGQFMWLDIVANKGAKFCGARITTINDADPIRDLHEAELEVALKMSLRCGAARDPQTTGLAATAASSAWAAHRLLARLAAIDPDGTPAFAAELAEELEDGDYGHEIADAAEGLGLNPQRWIDEENARRAAAQAAQAAS